jgi:hypothetical protein
VAVFAMVVPTAGGKMVADQGPPMVSRQRVGPRAREGLNMWNGAKVAAALFLLAACAEDKEQRKAQTDEFAKAAGEAEAQIAQQDDARCQSYGRPGSAAYIDCRTSLKNDRAGMKK